MNFEKSVRGLSTSIKPRAVLFLPPPPRSRWTCPVTPQKTAKISDKKRCVLSQKLTLLPRFMTTNRWSFGDIFSSLATDNILPKPRGWDIGQRHLGGKGKVETVLWIRNYFFGSKSGCNLYSGSGLFVKNTFELQICRSSKHHKKAVFFKPVHLWIRIVDEKYIWTADNLNMAKI